MTRRMRVVIIALFAAVCAIAMAVAAVVARWPHSPPGIPPEMVPAAWAQYRTTLGHTQHVGQGNMVCKDCHDYEREGFKNPGVAPCARCHAKEAGRFHAGNDTTKTDCLTCHVFKPNAEAPKCIGGQAAPEGHFAAIKGHATTECTQCHSPHGEPSLVPKDCAGCHKETARKHAEHPESKGCADCHQPHAPAAAAMQVCSTCHKEPAGPKPAGHDSCIGCHKAHDFVAGGASVCVGCHGVKQTLLAASVPAHAVCTSCHTPHDPASAGDSCVGCHSNIKVSHGGKAACVTCHQPHGSDTTANESTCTSCHVAIAVNDKGAHAGGTACTTCHKAHDFDPPKNKLALCATCHAAEATLASTNKAHTDCTSCHGVSTHKPAAAPPLRDLPREQDWRSTRGRKGWMRDVPPCARSRRSSGPTGVRDVSQERRPSGASLGLGARRLRHVPLVARAPAVRPRDVHGHLPHGSQDTSAASASVHGLPRLSSLDTGVEMREPRTPRVPWIRPRERSTVHTGRSRAAGGAGAANCR